MPKRNFPIRRIALASLLMLAIASGCRKEADVKVKKGQVTDEIFMKTPGFYVLSNRNEFMAIGVKCGAYNSMTLRLAKSNDGQTWTDFDGGIKSSKGDYQVIFNGEKVMFGAQGEKLAVARMSFLDGATNMAIAAKAGVEILQADSLANIDVRGLSYHQMGENRVDDLIKDQIDQLR